MHLLLVFSVSWCMDEAVDEAAVTVVRSVHPFSLAFWYFMHQDSKILQYVR